MQRLHAVEWDSSDSTVIKIQFIYFFSYSFYSIRISRFETHLFFCFCFPVGNEHCCAVDFSSTGFVSPE